jgi:FkbM family methyltransferase
MDTAAEIRGRAGRKNPEAVADNLFMVNDTEKKFGAYALGKTQSRLLRWAQAMPVSWPGRRAALILRKTVLLNGPVIVDALVDGLKLRLYTKDNVSERKFLFMPQFFDPFERGLLKKNLKAGDVFVDVGANAGIYSLTAAARIGDDGTVVSIEPNPLVLDRLKFNAALNGFEKRVIFEQSGVSSEDGSFDLILDESNLGGSSLVVQRSGQKISVRCHRLLAILQKYRLQKIDALKIDIEGAEDRALIPFFSEAPRGLYPKLLILENSPQDWRQDLPGALKTAGYRLLKITRMNQVWELS